ncbi:hypothetical protein PAMA_015636 [Pampus argenteus]
MTRFTSPALLLLLMVSLCVSSAEKNDTLVLYYRQRTVTLARDSSVKLSCRARYDFKQCGLLHVVWRHTQNLELTDPSRYLTTVNETSSDGNMRFRQVETEILHLTAEDNGQFQCNAECESGEKAIGHIIKINVTD